ncbi:hypothetical protein C5E43_12905 [Nocardia cyriacigeorgica]|nr:hypothetical protein C5B73_14050 [Nocardia cyriacigeorgica]PPJ10945.1 hypothetical protein C5E43_12905 [Nocardia cyriacigeorgica]
MDGKYLLLGTEASEFEQRSGSTDRRCRVQPREGVRLFPTRCSGSEPAGRLVLRAAYSFLSRYGLCMEILRDT